MKRAPAFGAAVILLALAAGRADARSFIETLFGQPPDSTARFARSPEGGLDSLDVPAWADLGYVFVEDLVTRTAGGDAARVGMDGVIRPIDLTGAGRGRTSLLFNGLPAGEGVIHWDNYQWIPMRALTTIGIERETAARPDASVALPGGRLVARTRIPAVQPASVVSITGGSFGQRLAELDFVRTYGKYGFHIDGADFNHAGVGAFGEAHRTRGFGEITFPLAGFRTAVDVAIGSGHVSAPGFGGGDMQKTAEKRYSLRFDRGSGRNVTQLSVLRHSSRFEVGEFSDVIPFTLNDAHWRVGYRRGIPAGDGTLGLDLSATRETRSGVVSQGNTFVSEEGVVSFTRPANWGFGYAARLGISNRDPAGFAIEPGIRISNERPKRRLWLSGGRTSGIPAILINQDQTTPDIAGVTALLRGLENLDRAESHWSFETGAVIASPKVDDIAAPRVTGRARAGVGLVAGADYTSNSLGWLSPSRGELAFQPEADPFWTGRVDATAFWAPRADLEFSLRGGYHAFDRNRQPFEPNFNAVGSLTIRRDFFDHDLHLSASAGGELFAERYDPEGAIYPTVLAGNVTVTGRIKTLTLFWRTENLASAYIESDLREAGVPVALPGLYNRIGATLRLVD